MKKLYNNCCIIFLLLFISNFSFSQNWQPLRTGWKYNYKLDNSSVITNTIWIDSSGVIGSDSIFYLNRIVSHCDSCTAALGGSNPCDSCYALKNQPQFLQRKVSKSANGFFYFNDTSKIVLNSLAAVNDSWLFDSVANISAQIISASLNAIFGINDSVKTILLSTGDTVSFSKSYGILQFPNLYGQNSYYYLTGIEGPNLGEQVPGFWQIFDFNVGDVFHYEGNYVDASTLPPVNVHYDKQYTITGKNVFTDSVSYTRQGLIWGYNIGTGSFSSLINDAVIYRDSAEHFSNYYNDQFLDVAYRIEATFGFIPWFPDSVFDYTEFSPDSNGIFTKSFGEENFFYNNYYLMNTPDLLNTLNVSSINVWLWTSYLKYKTGLGLTDYGYEFFEHYSNEHLIGYVKNGDTVGVISGMSPIIDPFPFFSVYPNPASDVISVNFINDDDSEILLTDIAGKKLFEKNFNSQYFQIDVKSFSSGIYILSVQSSHGNLKRKIIISRE